MDTSSWSGATLHSAALVIFWPELLGFLFIETKIQGWFCSRPGASWGCDQGTSLDPRAQTCFYFNPHGVRWILWVLVSLHLDWNTQMFSLAWVYLELKLFKYKHWIKPFSSWWPWKRPECEWCIDNCVKWELYNHSIICLPVPFTVVRLSAGALLCFVSHKSSIKTSSTTVLNHGIYSVCWTDDILPLFVMVYDKTSVIINLLN